MRTSMLFAMAALFAAPSIVRANDAPPRPAMNLELDQYNINLRDYNFPSGLRIIFQEDHTQPIISITAVVDRGASHDPLGKEGIAHLVEHLWFRSVHGEGQPKVWDILQETGANLNASTASDWTNYMTVAPKESLIPLLQLEALRIMEPVKGVSEEVVSTEREIVRNELRMRYENTDGSALAYVREQLYPEGHPYHRLGIGSHDSLNNIKLADVQAFCDKNYSPENVTIVVVGDFDVNNAWKYIQESFPLELLVDPANPDAEIELRDPPVRVTEAFDEPPPPADRTFNYHKGGVEKPTLVMAWALPGGYRSNQPLMSITVNMMNFAVQQALNEDFDPTTDDPSDVDSSGCFLWAEEVNSTALCFVEIGSGEKPEKVAEKVYNNLYLMWDVNQRPWQELVFSRSRYDWMAGVFRSVEVVSAVGAGRATETAEFTHFTGDPMYYSRQFEWLEPVTATAGREFAQKYLNRDRAVAVVIEPYSDTDITIDSSDAIYKGAVREAEQATLIDLGEVDANMLRSIMVPPRLSDVKRITLSNGLRVVMMPYGQAPIVRAQLKFDGGTWSEPRPGITEYTWDFMDFDVPAQDDPLRLAGAWEISGMGTLNQAMGIVASSANLDGALYLLRTLMDSAYVDVSEQKSYIKSNKRSLRSSRSKDVTWWEGAVTNSRLFPGHPAGRVRDEAYYDTISTYKQADAEARMAELIQPANGTLYVVGRMDPEQAEAAIRTYFEGWTVKGATGERAPLPPAPPPPPPTRQIVVLNKDRVSQTGATMACQIGPATVENLEARQMLAAVLDEEAWLALREQSGVTYGAGSGQVGYPGGAARLGISSLVQNDGAGLAAETFIRLSEEAARGELNEDTLTLMKLNEARNYALGQQTTYQMMERLYEPYADDFSYIEGHVERLAAVTVADMAKQMERCTGHEIITLTGPASVITPQLDKLGLSYEVYDWKAEADKLWAESDPKGYAKAKKKEAKAEAKKAAKGE